MSARRRPPVDLARARAAEERLAELLTEKPHLAERTAAMLAGDLPCPDLDDEEEAPPMRRSQTPVNVRLPDTMLARLDALAPLVGTAAELAMVDKVTRSDVLRLAVLKGLEQLEAEYAGHPALPGMGE
ncbi:MAG: ribbon-helix-helix domain-containing protein [Planctomycetota bacterium]|nr:ribbon-helix-helix domain-containing protein [Planctomycetota bacterium]